LRRRALATPASLRWWPAAPAKLVWLKDGFAGVQFDKPLSSGAERQAA